MSTRTIRFPRPHINPLKLERLEDRTNPAALDLFNSLATSFAAGTVPLPSTSPAAVGTFSVVQQAAKQYVANLAAASNAVSAESSLANAIVNTPSNPSVIFGNATAQDLATLTHANATYQASLAANKTGFDRASAQADLATSIFQVFERSTAIYFNNLPAATKALGEFTKAVGEFGQSLEAYYVTQFLGVARDLTSQLQDQLKAFADGLSGLTQSVEDAFNGYLQNAENQNQNAIDAIGTINGALEPNLTTQLAHIAQNNATLQAGMIAVFQAAANARQQIGVGESTVATEAFNETAANFNAESAAFTAVGLPPAGQIPDFAGAAIESVTNTREYVFHESDSFGDVFDTVSQDLIDSFGDSLQDRQDLFAIGFPASAFTTP
jgi:hypothetical protein